MPIYHRLKPSAKKFVNKHPAFAAACRYHTTDRGEDMTFRNRTYLVHLYVIINQPDGHRLVVEKSVQCGLSELFIINAHVEANSGLRVMYVLPKYALRDRFVQSRIKYLYNRNEFYRKKKQLARKLEGANRLGLSSFGDGIINFVGSNVADEFFETSVDSAYIDEKDLCDSENLLLIDGRLTASKYKFQREISNPSVDDGGIHVRYLNSTRGLWMIKCEHCNHEFTPDMFVHLVRQIGDDDQYEVIDPDYVPFETSPSLICDKCEKKVDRFYPGRWVHEFENREFSGYRISQLFSPQTDLGELLEKEETGFFDAVKSSTGKQVFFNTRLGLPFTAADAKITESALNECQASYPYPYPPDSEDHEYNSRDVFIGVDVGKILNVVIRERIVRGSDVSFRLLLACTVPNFNELTSLFAKYEHRNAVVDALPETHAVETLKEDFGKVYSCYFLESAIIPSIDKKKREMKIDRTTIIDTVKRSVDHTQLILPRDAKNRIPTYYSHMTAPTRTFIKDENKPDRSRFEWVGSSPDHYLFAEVYCRLAVALAPHRDMFDAYADKNKQMRGDKPKAGVPELTRKQRRNADQFLGDMRQNALNQLREEQEAYARRQRGQ